MGAVFIPQASFDAWDIDGKVLLNGTVMRLVEGGASFQVEPAVRFLRSVTDTSDPLELVGKVHKHAELAQAGWEHYLGSVIAGENAYDVEEGYQGVPIELQPTVDRRREDGRLRQLLAAL
jgi:hypothetical protein